MPLRYLAIIFMFVLSYVFAIPFHDVAFASMNKSGTDDLILFDNDINDIYLDDQIRMNQIQVIGTHNSYHLAPDPKLYKRMRFFSKEVEAWQYTHLPLNEQLQNQQIRQLELDVFPDPEGGLFSDRVGNLLIGEDRFTSIPQLMEPGFKVLHVPFVDFETTSYTFIEALATIRDWSLENRNHLPVMILVEVKSGIPLEYVNWPLRTLIRLGEFLLKITGNPLKMPLMPGEKDLMDLEGEILSVFENSHIITPDDVRGDFNTLEEAVMDKGWPTLSESRGRVFFALDNEDLVRDLYLKGNPSLEGRLMFTSSQPGEASAAFIKHNDPRGENEDLIRDYVKSGYIVRTRADADLEEALTKDFNRQEAAFRSGAQYISTDFPAPGREGYSVQLPGSEKYPARINPVNGLEKNSASN